MEVAGLDILEELHSRDHSTPLRPDRLEEDLVRIQRKDLANLVKQYKKSDDFKHAQKQEAKRVKKKGQTSKHPDETTKAGKKQSATADEQCSHMLSLAFMHAAQTVSQTGYFLDTVTDQAQLQSKEDLAGIITDVKKDFDSLGKSLKKAITATLASHSVRDKQTFPVTYRKCPSIPEGHGPHSSEGNQKLPTIEENRSKPSTAENQQQPSTVQSLTQFATEEVQQPPSNAGSQQQPSTQEYQVLFADTHRASPSPGYSSLSRLSLHVQETLPVRVVWRPLPQPRIDMDQGIILPLPPIYANLPPQARSVLIYTLGSKF